MPLSWNETWLEHTNAALSVNALNDGKLTVADLQAIRLRLRRACVELAREIAGHSTLRRETCKLCGDPISGQPSGMCDECYLADEQDAQGYGVDPHSFRSEK